MNEQEISRCGERRAGRDDEQRTITIQRDMSVPATNIR